MNQMNYNKKKKKRVNEEIRNSVEKCAKELVVWGRSFQEKCCTGKSIRAMQLHLLEIIIILIR